jgi:hypothetical protein
MAHFTNEEGPPVLPVALCSVQKKPGRFYPARSIIIFASSGELNL